MLRYSGRCFIHLKGFQNNKHPPFRYPNLLRMLRMSSPKIGDKRELNMETTFPDKKPRQENGLPTSEHVSLPDAIIATKQLAFSGQSEERVSHSSSKRAMKTAKKRRKQLISVEPYSHDDVHWHEVVSLLGQDFVNASIEEESDLESPFTNFEEIEIRISELSSNGEGLAVTTKAGRPWVVLVPFTLPGELVRAKIFTNKRLHSLADLISVIEPNVNLRDMKNIRCRYFGKCAGCQYQMISYDNQLDIKRNVIVKAYRTFSGLPSSSVPNILSTAPSPLQYGYRTKLTPHFEIRSHGKSKSKPRAVQNREDQGKSSDQPPINIGFAQMGRRQVMDIEECPIATIALNDALGPIRERTLSNINNYKRGATLILRDSLERNEQKGDHSATERTSERHICVTDHKAIVRERVGDMIFEYPANSFFQNNNSILKSLVDYVRAAIFENLSSDAIKPTHLVDAYCGSGFFSIMLSPQFGHIAGIELSQESISSARTNAVLNGIPSDKCTFHAGDASAIFDSVRDFPSAQTVVLIDPPRKGCDEKFINQLLSFRSATIVYVSCNVHTQARDVGMILQKSEADKKGRYSVESIRGFDLFPQTAHVESVAILRLCTE